MPKVVAELGPGSSMGMGFAALIAGADKYYALDLIDHSQSSLNLDIFDKLVNMFRKKERIPASGYLSQIFPDLDHYNFPEFLSFQPDANFEKRVVEIRNDIIARSGVFFEVAAPWMQSHIVKEKSVDWVFSHSVLEHVDDLNGTYRAIAEWLKPLGYATHLIDFNCHNLTREWNGHWAIADGLWDLTRGKRPYFLNRSWCSAHLRLAAKNGFETVLEKRFKQYDGLIREQFASQFQAMNDEDARTKEIFLVSKLSA